jgi:hypothetical protein
MSQSEIMFNHFLQKEDMEDAGCDLSIALRKNELDLDFCSDSYERQLVPYKSDNDTDSSCQEGPQRNHALFYLDFGDDKSSDFFAPAESTKLFGQLHRLPENLNLQLHDRVGLHEIDYNAEHCEMTYSEAGYTRRMETESKSLNELVPALQCRRPLPLLYFEKTPVYVNAKQYDRILKLRNKKLAAGRIKGPNYVFERPKSKTYRHESRSQHAKNRKRGENGRFLTKEELAEMELNEIPQDKTHLCPKIKKRAM